MKKQYLAIGLVQFSLILASGLFRRLSWHDIDPLDDGHNWPLSAHASFYLLLGWVATIILASWLAARDQKNRSMIALFLIMLLPSIEFFLWIAVFF